jgi:hypothetical protein
MGPELTGKKGEICTQGVSGYCTEITGKKGEICTQGVSGYCTEIIRTQGTSRGPITQRCVIDPLSVPHNVLHQHIEGFRFPLKNERSVEYYSQSYLRNTEEIQGNRFLGGSNVVCKITLYP